MLEIYAVGTLALSVVLVGWLVRYLVGKVDAAASDAARSHLMAVLERERAERLVGEARTVLESCRLYASAAHDAAEMVEEFADAEFEDEQDEQDDDPDDDDYLDR